MLQQLVVVGGGIVHIWTSDISLGLSSKGKSELRDSRLIDTNMQFDFLKHQLCKPVNCCCEDVI